MIPTFHTGDFLYVRSGVKNLKTGDVIVFPVQDSPGEYIVHRIIANTELGFITCGDHNRLKDLLPISPKDIIGRVEIIENRNGTRKILNGNRGAWLGRFLRSSAKLERILKHLLWIPYNFIKERRLVAFFWHPTIMKIALQSEKGRSIKYLYKNRTAAIWDVSSQQINYYKPFDLVIPVPDKTKNAPM
jgi:signal peptidase I